MLRRLYERLRTFFKPRAPISSRLSPEALAAVRAEAAFLETQGVSVRALAPGEQAGKPQAADPALEESFRE